jgi:hypothetical protein
MRAIVRYVLTAALRARVSACCIILLATALAATCRANEIEGMKLGMSFDQIRRIAASEAGRSLHSRRRTAARQAEGRPLHLSM